MGSDFFETVSYIPKQGDSVTENSYFPLSPYKRHILPVSRKTVSDDICRHIEDEKQAEKSTMGKDIPKAIMKTTYCVFSYPVPFYIECPYYTIVPQLCQTTAMTYAASADADACGNFIMAVLNHFFRTFRNISIVIVHGSK